MISRLVTSMGSQVRVRRLWKQLTGEADGLQQSADQSTVVPRVMPFHRQEACNCNCNSGSATSAAVDRHAD